MHVRPCSQMCSTTRSTQSHSKCPGSRLDAVPGDAPPQRVGSGLGDGVDVVAPVLVVLGQLVLVETPLAGHLLGDERVLDADGEAERRRPPHVVLVATARPSSRPAARRQRGPSSTTPVPPTGRSPPSSVRRTGRRRWTARGRARSRCSWRPDRRRRPAAVLAPRPPADRAGRSRRRGRGPAERRLTRIAVTSPVASSRVATASSVATSPKRSVRCTGESTAAASTSPRAWRAVAANGWKID